MILEMAQASQQYNSVYTTLWSLSSVEFSTALERGWKVDKGYIMTRVLLRRQWVRHGDCETLGILLLLAGLGR